ncbi:MAG: hypothetical protein Ct9H300mP8_07350 [Gammaproteobacteria bacterium]|nr:MAG: hypothetical protein Ct9H300mP8_07350 [Gammaproteobacteria bacterium]
MRIRALGTSATASGDSNRPFVTMLNLRLFALGMFCICLGHVADAAWNGAELLEICEVALDESDDLTNRTPLTRRHAAVVTLTRLATPAPIT